jgi:hypothetical protein
VSVLDDVLDRPGVYRWDGDDDSTLWTEAFERDDVRLVAVGPAAGKEEMLASFAEALRFPEWFGRNYDALADLLHDTAYVHGTVVLWRGWALLAQADPDAFAAFLDLLSERAAQPGFGVLLHGAGPPVDLPFLE